LVFARLLRGLNRPRRLATAICPRSVRASLRGDDPPLLGLLRVLHDLLLPGLLLLVLFSGSLVHARFVGLDTAER